MRQLKLSLLTLTTILAISLPTYAQDQQSNTQQTTTVAQASSTDLIGVGASLINSLLNPPSRSAEINADAEVKKAKIAAEAEITKEKLRIEASKSTDRVTPVLNQWGVTRVACGPGLVFVNGITTDTVCIQPSNAMAAGYYTYDSAKQQLLRNNGTSVQTNNNNSANNSAPTNNNTPTHSVTQTSNIERSNTNVQTIQNTQTVRTSNPNRSNRREGF